MNERVKSPLPACPRWSMQMDLHLRYMLWGREHAVTTRAYDPPSSSSSSRPWWRRTFTEDSTNFSPLVAGWQWHWQWQPRSIVYALTALWSLFTAGVITFVYHAGSSPHTHTHTHTHTLMHSGQGCSAILSHQLYMVDSQCQRTSHSQCHC